MEEGRRTAAVLTALLVAACGDKAPPASAPAVGKVLAAVLDEADRQRAPWRCAALDTPALPPQQLELGPRRWTLEERTLRQKDSDGALAIGVVADAGGAAPRTVAALARLRAELEKSAPDLVLSLGGMATTQPDLEAALGTLAEGASWPLVALPGDLEPASVHAAAIAALRGRGAAVLDGRLVRWVELPGATIGTLPGAGAAERLVAGADGCAWRADDVAKLYAELTRRPGVRIAASAEAPRGSVGGEPAGELGLVPPQPIEVALHGPLAPVPTSAKSGGRDGRRVPISPGTSDATRRLPDAHAPSAGILVIRAGTWSWRPLVDSK